MATQVKVISKPAAPKSTDESELNGDEPVGVTISTKGGSLHIDPKKYYQVMFHEKLTKHEQENVELHVNGKTIVLQRGRQAIIPGSYLEAANAAKVPVYQRVRSKGRMITNRRRGWRHIFSFSILGEATRQEYNEVLAAGTKMYKDEFEKRGMGYDTDDGNGDSED